MVKNKSVKEHEHRDVIYLSYQKLQDYAYLKIKKIKKQKIYFNSSKYFVTSNYRKII